MSVCQSKLFLSRRIAVSSATPAPSKSFSKQVRAHSITSKRQRSSICLITGLLLDSIINRFKIIISAPIFANINPYTGNIA
jgi:hypothetical protein